MASEREGTQPAVASFLEAISPVLPAYKYATISFVSVIHEGYETILRASLRLAIDVVKEYVEERSIVNLRAAQLPLPGGASGIGELLRSVLQGEPILAGEHLLKLLPTNHGYSTYQENPEEFRRRTREYGDRLVIGGVNPWPLVTPGQRELDNALRAQAFDSLADLLHEYGLDAFDMSAECTFEVTAGAVAQIEPRSSIAANWATVSVRLASGLRQEGFRLTLRNPMRQANSTPCDRHGRVQMDKIQRSLNRRIDV